MSSFEPGWHPDPGTPGRLRYHDGTGWTEHTADPISARPPEGGVLFGEPAVAAPATASSAGGPAAGAPSYGAASPGDSSYGAPSYGAPSYGGPAVVTAPPTPAPAAPAPTFDRTTFDRSGPGGPGFGGPPSIGGPGGAPRGGATPPRSWTDKLAVPIAAIVAIVAVGGVGWWVFRDDDDSVSTEDRTARATEVAERGIDVDDLLLDFEDVPTGWVREYPDDEDEDEESSDDPECLARAEKDLAHLGSEDFEPEDEAEVSYSNDGIFPYLVHSVARFDSTEQADQIVGAFDTTFGGCDTWQEVDDGETVSYTFAPLLLGGIEGADRVGAYRLETARADIRATSAIVFGHVDEYAFLLLYTDLGSVSSDQVVELVNTALAKF